eukprot:TRINITY_DN14113_c0_g1_i1.p1 TRINITY_DN14113_c0_g1~~TRINITY_DN14113_c0_g1_i1.p1  ORF type:complete len:205 (-),score=44.73 TRINITY_DN14113_c0_g1_i1:2-616(-)
MLIGKIENERLHGFGLYIFGPIHQRKYVLGQFLEGYYNGKTLISYRNGDRFIGECLNSKRTGTCRIEYKATNCIYEGEWMNGQKNGKGTMIWPETGYSFTCTFKDNFPEDESECLSNEVKRAIREGRCTSNVVPVYAQFLRRCDDSPSWYCDSCFEVCNQTEYLSSVLIKHQFSIEINCHCEHHPLQCLANPDRPTKKKRNDYL